MFLLAFTLKHKAQCGLYPVQSYSYDCVSGGGVATFTVNGGVPPLTYTWVNVANATVSAGTAAGNIISTNVTPGPYTLYITSNGCTQTVYFSLTSGVSPANVVFTTTMVSCFGGNNGIATTTVTGGALTPPLSFTWSNGSSVATASSLPVGVHTVTLSDVNGCVIVNTVQITSPPVISSTFANTFVPCFGGTINSVVSSTGGVSPFNYTVNGTAVPSNTVGNLSAGVNTITAIDSKGCVRTSTVQIAQAAAPVISFTVTKPSCPNSTNGAVSAGVTGAPPSVSYTWQPVVSFSAGISNIPIGNYTLTVKDGSACITKSVVNVAPNVVISSSVLTNPENCSAMDGAFTLNVSGGLAPYTFSTVSVGSHTSNVLSGLSSGVYTTVITDNSNCKDTVKILVGNLSTVSVSVVSFSPVLCYSQCTGSVQVNVVNAVQPVTYSATGTPTTNSSTILNLCAGLITIKAIDAIGCPATTTINFPTPPAFSYSAANPPAACIGKTFTLQASASGGTGAYSYVWNPGNLTGQSIAVTSSATTIYSLNVYDGNGCTLAPFSVTVNVNPALAINLNPSNSGICPGTTAQISPTITGGDGNYNYNWSPGNFNGPSIYVENITVPFYTLTVTDACGSPAAVKIVIVNLFPVTVPTFYLASNTGCQPFCAKFINTTAKASDIIWNYGDRPFEQRGDTTNYCYENAGKFNLRLTLRDSNFCKSSYTYTQAITVIPKPNTDFVTDPKEITLNESQGVSFVNTTADGKDFVWLVNGVNYSQSRNMEYSFADTGCVVFSLIAGNENNCMDTLQKNICITEGFNFWMPEAFSPNADLKNDTLMPKGTGWTETDYLFEIYNRWGKRIFKTSDVKAGWDGNINADEDTDPFNQYFWHIRITDIYGTVQEKKGFSLLLK